MVDADTRYRQACEFTAFYKKIALLIEPFLSTEYDLVDIGCGYGMVDIELAPMVREITAIDDDAEVLAVLDTQIDDLVSRGRRHCARINTLLADRDDLGELMRDVVLLCFSAIPIEEIESMLARARKKAIIICHGHKPAGIFDPLPEVAFVQNEPDVETWLNEKGYKYRKNHIDMQFGQPFKSIEDIHDYLLGVDEAQKMAAESELGRKTGRVLDIEDIRLMIEERIEKTERFDFPYYLPLIFGLCVFIIDIA